MSYNCDVCGGLVVDTKCPAHWGDEDTQAIMQFRLEMQVKFEHSKIIKGRSGWRDMTVDELWQALREHVDKGDPVDVGLYAMMIYHNRKKQAGT